MDLRAESAAAATSAVIVLAASPVPFFGTRSRDGAWTAVESRIRRSNWVLKDGGQSDEPPCLGPVVEPPPLTVPEAQSLGQVATIGPGPGDPPTASRKRPVVSGNPAVLAWSTWQEVLDPLPVSVRDGVSVVHSKPSMASGQARPLPKTSFAVHDLGQRPALGLTDTQTGSPH